VEVGPVLPTLAPPVVHHLRMIAQEAVTNAIKHARATSIILGLHQVDGSLVLSIEDDGAGFDANANTLGQPGHFGCMGIRERCRKIGAHPTWKSQPGAGTRVTVTLPLAG
jgi:signal transduction histidine kinase